MSRSRGSKRAFGPKHMDILKKKNWKRINQLTCLTIWMSEPIWHRSQISGLFSNRTSLIFCNIIAWLSSMPFSWFRDISNSWAKWMRKKLPCGKNSKKIHIFIFNETEKKNRQNSSWVVNKWIYFLTVWYEKNSAALFVYDQYENGEKSRLNILI